MATCSGGTSSGSMGSEEDLQNLMDQRKRKRMISNRESARRSRMKKQKHLDDLTAQVSQLMKENAQIITTVDVTSQHYLRIESENSILRAQVDELSHRLESLNEIINLIDANNNSNNNGGYCFRNEELGYGDVMMTNDFWNYPCVNQQPIMACADMLMY